MSISQGNPTLTVGAKCVDSGGIEIHRICALDSTSSATQTVISDATANTEKPFGVIAEPTTSTNGDVTVIVSGIAEVEVLATSSNIAVGDYIVASTAGKGAKAPTADATARYVLGTALEASTADGDIIPVLIDRTLYVKGTA